MLYVSFFCYTTTIVFIYIYIFFILIYRDKVNILNTDSDTQIVKSKSVTYW